MKKNLILCLLLALAMMVSLTACQVEIPGIGTVNINDGSTGGNAGGDNTIHTGSDNDESLALLRKSMAEVPDYIFAAAYISSAAGGPDDFELPIQEWVSKAAPNCAPSIPSFGIFPVSGWWAAAAACSAWCPVTPTHLWW